MPTYRVKAPDGKFYDVEMPIFGTEQDAQDYVNKAYPAPPQAGFFQALKEGFQTAGDLPEALSFAGASPEDAAAKREALLKAQQPEYAYTSWQDVQDVSSGIDWLKQNAGRSFGFMAGPGLAGAAATAMKTPGVGRVVGGGLLGLQYLTENLGRQAGEQEQAIQGGRAPDATSIGRAVLASAGQTALDVWQAKMFAPLYRKFPGMAKMLGEEGEEATKETTEQLITAFRNKTLKMSNGVATAVVRGSLIEVPQEIAQQALERWQAGLSLSDDSAKQEYIEAAAGAIALGSTMGAASKYFENAGRYARAEALDRADREKAEEAKKIVRKETTRTNAIIRQGMTDDDKLAHIDNFVRSQPPTGDNDLKAALKAAFPGLVRDSRDAGIQLNNLKNAGIIEKGADGRWVVKADAPPPKAPTKPYVKPEAPGTTAPADTTTPTPPGTTAPADTTTPADTTAPNPFSALGTLPAGHPNAPAATPAGTTTPATDTNLAEKVGESQTPVEKPRVDSIPRLHIGMGVFNTSVVAEGKPLYRETSVAKLSDSLGLPKQFAHFPSFVTDDETLALGQGDNKGVLVKYRPNSVSGEEHSKPGTGIIGGREYRTNVLAPDPVESITFRNPADIRKLDGVSAFRINRNFSRTANPDGSVTYTRKPMGVAPRAQETQVQAGTDTNRNESGGAGASTALPVQQAPAAETGQAQAPERGGVGTPVTRDERPDVGTQERATPLTQHLINTPKLGSAISRVARALFNAGLFRTSAEDTQTEDTTDENAPQKEIIETEGNINKQRTAQLLGTSLYGSPKEIGIVSLKEILQNSFDAVKDLIGTDPNFKGKIDFHSSDDRRTLTVLDNGVGMAPELLGGKFLEIAGTDKEKANSTGSSGGFGIAKMLFLYGNKRIHVITMNNGVVSEMKTTGNALINSLDRDNPDYAPIIINVYGRNENSPITDEMSKLFPDNHGTWIQVEIDEEYVDDSTGETKKIDPLPEAYGINHPLDNSLLFRDIKVTYDAVSSSGNRYQRTMPIGQKIPRDIKPFTNVVFNWGNMRVYITDKKDVYSKNVHILSNGVWQFSTDMKINPMEYKRVPYEIYFDIQPTVKPSKPGYPFMLNRQGFNPSAKNDFGQVFNYVNMMFRFQNLAEGTKSYGNIRYLEKQSDGKISTSEGEDLTPTMPNVNSDFNPIGPDDRVEIRDGVLYLNGQPQPTVTPVEIASAVPDDSTLMIDPSMVNPDKVMLHDNTDVVNHQTNETKPAIDLLADEFGKQNVDRFMYEVGETFRQLRDLVADVMGYDGLKNEAVGISIDAYRGVSTRAPLSGSFVNPFLPEAGSREIYRRANGIWGTMIHELAHHKVRSHDASFPAEMQRIQYALESLIYELADDPVRANLYNNLRQEFVQKIAGDPVYNKMMDRFTEIFDTTQRERYESNKTIGLKTRQQSLDSSSSFERPEEGGTDGATPSVSTEGGGTAGGQGVPAGTPTGNQPAQNGGQSGSAAKKAGRKRAVNKNLFANAPYVKKKVNRHRVLTLRDESTDEAQEKLVRDMTTNTTKKSIFKTIWDAITSYAGFETAVRKIQNDRRPLKALQDALEWAGKLIVTGKGFNNIYDQITLSTGRAYNALNLYLTKDLNELDGLVVEYSKKSGRPINDALARLHVYMMGLHEPERRFTKYLFNVPLENDDTKKNYKLDGVQGTALENVQDTPHELRMAILKELYRDVDLTNAIDATGKSTAEKYRAALESLVEKYKDNTKGKSGTSMRDVDASSLSLDINSGDYNVIGSYSTDSIKRFKESYDADPNKEIVDKIAKKMQEIGDTTTQLSKKANYWTQPVENISKFYGWKYYVPFKGKGATNVSQGDERFELRGKGMGGGMTEFAMEFGGRESDSDNPILQVKVDAIKAAMRFGRHGISQALVNLMRGRNGYIKGAPYKTIKFKDRYNGLTDADKQELKGENLFYHYLPDGTIEIRRILDPVMREALRKSYEAPNPVLGMIGQVTNFMGHTHTRWNPSFHPYNFVRDILTNAFAFGAEFGPMKSFQLIESVTATVIHKGGFRKSALVSRMYGEGRVNELKEMAKTDVFIRDLLEYLEEGGKVSYIMGLSNKSQLDEMLKDIDANGFAKTKETITKYLDIWGDVFELSSRAATYSALKSTYLAEGLTEKAAKQRAASYAKNLANFEQVGEWGRNLGSLFMFFRPAATGAIRAFDSIKTVFYSADDMLALQPAKLRNNAKAVEQFKKTHAEQRKRAIQMMSTLAAAGAAIFTIAMMAADDDDSVPPRNQIATDDMSLWTRNIRLPLSFLGEDKFLQIPWGFGLGAFMAAGAQVAGMAFGASTIKDIAPNFVTLALDSYIPIPVSRIDPRENPGMWILDSAMPSIGRPLLEFTVNTDSLGREVYNNRLTKYGDPYIAGKNVPELYRKITVGLTELTNGGIQWQPSTVQFVASNLADGWARMAVNLHGLSMLATDESKFNPKTDLALLSSFIGQKSNYDARQFAELENKMKEYKQTYSMFERDPKQLQRWLDDHPNMDVALYVFNQGINGQLRTLRAEYNQLLGSRVRKADGSELTPAERRYFVEENLKMQNAIKRGFIDMMEQYKID